MDDSCNRAASQLVMKKIGVHVGSGVHNFAKGWWEIVWKGFSDVAINRAVPSNLRGWEVREVWPGSVIADGCVLVFQ